MEVLPETNITQFLMQSFQGQTLLDAETFLQFSSFTLYWGKEVTSETSSLEKVIYNMWIIWIKYILFLIFRKAAEENKKLYAIYGAR